MPIIVIDLMLWGIEESSSLYVRYWNENIQYLPRAIRGRINVMVRGMSVIKNMEVAHRNLETPEKRDTLCASIDAVHELLNEIEKFRYPHLSVAKANMKIREKGAQGSGGYDTLILEYLLAQTHAAKERLRKLKEKI